MQFGELSDLIERIVLKFGSQRLKDADRFLQLRRIVRIDVEHLALSRLEPMQIDAVKFADVSERQFFGIDPPVFEVADNVAAHPQSFAKFPLGKSERFSYRFDSVRQKITPLLKSYMKLDIFHLTTQKSRCQHKLNGELVLTVEGGCAILRL